MQAAAAEEAEAAAALARGKRSKLRRVREKYAHQDEEDRQLALEVLAPAGIFTAHEYIYHDANGSEMVLERLFSMLARRGPKRLLWNICSLSAHPHSMLNTFCSAHQGML